MTGPLYIGGENLGDFKINISLDLLPNDIELK